VDSEITPSDDADEERLTMPITEQLPEVDQPQHKLSELTTYELRDFRRQLEKAVAYFDQQDPVPPVRGNLQATLDAVIAEQEDRVRLAHA
jgi:hypothetical protein